MSRKSILKAGVAAATLAAAMTGWQSQVVAQAAGAQPGQGGIETVVVTAEKRVENVQNVPATVNVIGGAKLEQLGATDLADYAGYVPGLNIVQGVAPGNDTLVIRGLDPQTPTALVGTYIDDTPFGSSGSFAYGGTSALDLLPYDISRVEVLEGPQGTLYGANSEGGLVKYVTNKPDLDNFFGRVGASISAVDNGDSPGWDFRGMVNIPLVTDQLALRASYTDDVTPGFIDYPNQGKKDDNLIREQAGHVAVRYQPTSDLTIDLSALLQFVDSPNAPYVTLTPALTPNTGSLSNSQTIAQPYSSRTEYYAATVNYNFGWSTLTSASSWSTLHSKQTAEAYYPFNATPFASYATMNTTSPLDKFTQELRLASSTGGPVDWLVGAFFTQERSDAFQEPFLTSANGTPLPNPFPEPPPYTGFLNPFADLALPEFYREMAVFTHDTWHVTDAFDVAVGARWSQNNQHFFADTRCSFASDLVAGPCPTQGPGASVGDIVNWEVSPEYHFSSDVMAYARIATGYSPGGPNLPVPGATLPKTYGSDELTNYEAGLKSQWLDNTLQVNASAYEIEWTKIQITALSGPYSFTTNGNAAQARGFEISSLYSPISDLHLGANLTYTDTFLSQPMPAGASLKGVAGNAFPMSPRFNASATADYDYPINNEWTADFGGGWRYMSSRFVTVNNPGNCPPTGPGSQNQCLGLSYVPKLPSTSIFDAHIGVSDDVWTVKLIARNLFNEHAWVNIAGGTGPAFLPSPPFPVSSDRGAITATPLQPRLIMLSVDRSF